MSCVFFHSLAQMNFNYFVVQSICSWFQNSRSKKMMNSIASTSMDQNYPEVLLANKIPNTTCVRQADGCYETGLLWKDNSSLPKNRSQALTHLNHLVNRLQKKPEQFKKYNEGIQADLEKGYIAQVSFHRQKDTGWYIPHYGLVSPNKPNEIQRFCNAKAPQKRISLNDKLLAGPDLLGKMLGILLQFRQGAIAIQGNIEAMFMPIGVQQEDRCYLRFTWRQSQPRIKGVRIPTTHLWSQGLTSLRKFLFCNRQPKTTSKITQNLWRSFSGQYTWMTWLHLSATPSQHYYSQGCQGYSEKR